MSKVKGPCFSFEVHNAIGKKVIFVRSKGQNIAKSYFKPSNPNTPGQQAWRDHWAYMRFIWKFASWSKYDYLAWEFMAKTLNPRASGVNLFYKSYSQWDRSSVLGSWNDVFVSPLGFPEDVDFQAHPAHSYLLTIVRGPHTGFTAVSFLTPMLKQAFIVPFRNKLDLFTITSLTPGRQMWTGFYPLDETWFI